MIRRCVTVIPIGVLTTLFLLGMIGIVIAADGKKAQTLSKGVPKSSTSSVSKSLTASPPSAKVGHPLGVMRIYLKGHTVFITLVNTGAQLAAKDHNLVRLKIGSTSGRLKKQWPLTEVDPQKKLMKPKGRVLFNTGLKVTRPERVTVELSKKDWKVAKHAMLSVPPQKGLTGVQKSTVGPGSKPPPPAHPTTPKKTNARRSTSSHATSGPQQASAGQMLYAGAGGIQITNPGSAQVWRAGTAVTVRYRFEDEVSAGPVQFKLYNRQTNRKMAETTVNYAPSYGDSPGWTPPDEAFIWHLPGNLLPGTDYYLQAAGCGQSGKSETFAVEPLVDLGGAANFIEVLEPRGGEIFRPGGTLTVRFRFTHPDRPRPERIHIDLTHSDYSEVPFPLIVESGNINQPETEIVLRIPEGLPDQVLGYVVRVGGLAEGETESQWGSSRLFSITSATTFGETGSASVPQDERLVVLSPGAGGEYYKAGTVHKLKWRFYAGGDTIPGTWLVTLLRATSTGYRIVNSFTPANVAVHNVTHSGLTWLAHSTEWVIPDDVAAGDYKIRVSGLSHRGDSHLNFRIGAADDQWDLSIASLSADYTNLIAEIRNVGGVTSTVAFKVETMPIDSTTVLSSKQVSKPILASGGPVVLGSLATLVGGWSEHDCGIHVRVSIDTDNRIDEANEEDNTKTAIVYHPARIGQVQVVTPHTGSAGYSVLGTGSEVTCNTDRSTYGARHAGIALVELKNCSVLPANGRIRVYQAGSWISGGRLTPTPQRRLILDRAIRIIPSMETPLRENTFTRLHTVGITKNLLVALVDSSLEIHIEGDFAEWSHSPIVTLNLRMVE